uniref:Uncharacterized protein n=1 Tax=Rhizophora mucronata TaxID=61149 RepID=A0A2P2PMW2_RHIMU
MHYRCAWNEMPLIIQCRLGKYKSQENYV